MRETPRSEIRDANHRRLGQQSKQASTCAELNPPLLTHPHGHSIPSIAPETHHTPYVHTRGTKSHQRIKGTRSKAARERLETKAHLVELAHRVGQHRVADRIDRCHSRVAVLTCGKHVAAVIPNDTCEFRLCPDCARRRSRRMIHKHLPIMTAFLAQNRVEAVHLVLTQKHRPESRKRSVKRLRDAFTKLQRRGFWKEHFAGGMWSLEFTKGKDGFHHTHFHIIAFRRRWFDIALLRDEWLAVTGDSVNVRLDRVGDLRKGLLELVKYISKPADTRRFDEKDFKEFLGMKNMRFFGTFGEYRKFAKAFEPDPNDAFGDAEFAHLTEGSCCPFEGCGDPLFDVRLSGKELPDFLRRIEMAVGERKATE